MLKKELILIAAVAVSLPSVVLPSCFAVHSVHHH
jgi:hypothetical protein